MVTGIYKSKILTKHISCEYKCKFGCRKCSSNQKGNKDICWYECKNPRNYHVCGRDYIWNPITCGSENGKYFGSIIGHSVIMCDEIIEVTKTVSTKVVPTKTIPTYFNGKKETC